MKGLLDAALAYAARGWPVLPCRPDKAPYLHHGVHDSATDPQMLATWWSRWPDAAIGVACGPAGLFVVDCDVRPDLDGIRAFEALGILHDGALHSQTPSGGLHIVFRNRGLPLGNSVKRLTPGTDTRGVGGYFIVPPSIISHGAYVALDDWNREPAELPDELRVMLENRRQLVQPVSVPSSESTSAYGAAALEAEVARVVRAQTGERNSILNRAAFSLGQLVAGGELDDAAVRTALLPAALSAGLGEREARSTIESGLHAGAATPRSRLTNGHAQRAQQVVPETTSKTTVTAGSMDAATGEHQPMALVALPRDLALAPELPEYARLTETQEAEALTTGAWLGSYVDFASAASPMTPAAFHVAAGAFLGALAIARRLYVDVSVGNPIFPNLYLLYVGPSTVQRKTTALRVVKSLLVAAELEHLLLADQQTPEALAMDMTTRIPATYTNWQPTVQTRWLRERALAAQRGWLLEEASRLLQSFTRDFTAGLLPMVLDLYDCPQESVTRNTLARGRELIENAYLSVFGVTTYGDIAEHVETRRLWSNGLFARFGLVGSEDVGSWRFWPEPTTFPSNLVSEFHRVATNLLPLPEAYIVEIDPSTNDGEATESPQLREVRLTMPLVASPVVIERGGLAWNAWERYARATSFDMLVDGAVHDDFRPSYGRLGTTLIKIATVLAAFDTQHLPVVLEPRHIYRAQQIVEPWRVNLHRILGKTRNVGVGGQHTASIRAALTRAGRDWVSRRDLLRALNVNWGDLATTMEDMHVSGEIEQMIVKNPRGPASWLYRLIVDEGTETET